MQRSSSKTNCSVRSADRLRDATLLRVRGGLPLESREQRGRRVEGFRDLVVADAVELEFVPLPLRGGTHVVQVVDEGARRGLRETDGGLAGDVVAVVDSSKFFHLLLRGQELGLDLPYERARDVARLNFRDVEAEVLEEIRLRYRDRVHVLVEELLDVVFARASVDRRSRAVVSLERNSCVLRDAKGNVALLALARREVRRLREETFDERGLLRRDPRARGGGCPRARSCDGKTASRD